MPSKILRPCSYPGCSNLVKSGRCSLHSTTESDADHSQVRRDRIRANGHVPYSRIEIYKRDHFTCHICGGLLNMRAKNPAPDSPTIDHLIPLAQGGKDIPSNVKAAHFLCNSTRGGGGVKKLSLSDRDPAAQRNAKKIPNVENPV